MTAVLYLLFIEETTILTTGWLQLNAANHTVGHDKVWRGRQALVPDHCLRSQLCHSFVGWIWVMSPALSVNFLIYKIGFISIPSGSATVWDRHMHCSSYVSSLTLGHVDWCPKEHPDWLCPQNSYVEFCGMVRAGEGFGRWVGHEDGALKNEICALRRDRRQVTSLCCERKQWESSCLYTRKRVHTRSQPCWHSIFGLSASRTMRNKCLFLSQWVCGILL